jgi:membrane fusion protein, copper/silver efflux system
MKTQAAFLSLAAVLALPCAAEPHAHDHSHHAHGHAHTQARDGDATGQSRSHVHEQHDHDTQRRSSGPASNGASNGTHAPAALRTGDDQREILYWYDPMYPQHRFERPGRSPFMDMDLVPRYAGESEPGEVHVPTSLQQIMNIRTAAVEVGTLPRRIDTVGRVAYDESRIHHLHPRVSGWIEEVNVHAIGEAVERGQVLYTMYSPELVNAQEEFLHAVRRGEASGVRAGREKLRAFGVQPEVIEELERDRDVRQALPWVARHGGVVSELNIRHGMFVEPGDPLLALVDLSSVWVIADVFDRHATWLALGQPAEVSVPHGDGRTLRTNVGHIYPHLDPATRTVQVRLPIENANGTLKPGMWSTVRILAAGDDAHVLIPREAVIRTGHSTRVVVRLDDMRFAVRDVQPGAEAGDWVEILSGLTPGEFVVVSGHFLLDSEAALGPARHRLEGIDHRQH